MFIDKSTMLSVTAKHALRALAHLASLPPGHTAGGRDIAAAADIPPNYLSKILWTLGSAGLIDATRGTGGGYRLRRPSETVRLVEVVELFDKARSGSACILGGPHACSDETACAAHATWKVVKHAYLAFLEQTTLATLAACDTPVIHQDSLLREEPHA
ncbi:MAG: Rrf2 family transcriptional regulator [Vicinamibacteraceae bacterium]|nr:Rrf2 family transcriptional regulator [Vicinamibacteraceae bacterium]